MSLSPYIDRHRPDCTVPMRRRADDDDRRRPNNNSPFCDSQRIERCRDEPAAVVIASGRGRIVPRISRHPYRKIAKKIFGLLLTVFVRILHNSCTPRGNRCCNDASRSGKPPRNNFATSSKRVSEAGSKPVRDTFAGFQEGFQKRFKTRFETSSGPFDRVPEGSVVCCVSGHSWQGAISMAKKKKKAAKKVAKKKKGHG